ncbi:MAG: hypothetical protein LRY35_01575 [Clostridiales bacterium]|nr:hypothetical protein [Clostridiales bacterium]
MFNQVTDVAIGPAMMVMVVVMVMIMILVMIFMMMVCMMMVVMVIVIMVMVMVGQVHLEGGSLDAAFTCLFSMEVVFTCKTELLQTCFDH